MTSLLQRGIGNRMRMLVLLFAALAVAAPAAAQNREPAQRQILLDLAYVLGEAHALRQVCSGPSDQFWRGRMLRMLETERPEYEFEERLRQTFNTGYVSRQARYTTCSAESRAAETSVSARGAQIAQRLTARPAQADSLAPR